jgi:hypothetical protein
MDTTNAQSRNTLPLVMGAHDLEKMGFSKSMTYKLLNRKDFPTVIIGGRKFINRDRFFEWLDQQTN